MPVTRACGGQVGQSWMTVEGEPFPGAEIVTAGHVGQGLLTVTPGTLGDDELGVTRGQVVHGLVRVTVGFEPVVDIGPSVMVGQVEQSIVVVNPVEIGGATPEVRRARVLKVLCSDGLLDGV